MTELRGIVTGKVQGVRFRDYVQVVAGELEVFGYVENKLDGSVYVIAQAEPEILKDFVEYLHEGSVLSVVDAVAVEWGAPKINYSDFSIK